jgi:hypothetical protein
MKKYIIALFAATALAGTSCQDYLEEKMVTTLTSDYYKSPEGLESLAKGCYQILRFKSDYNQGHYLFGSSTDVERFSWSAAERQDMGSYNVAGWGPSSGANRFAPHMNALLGQVSGGVSEGVYPEVNRCNIFLENYTNLSDVQKKSLAARKGEVLFLRAYSYYMLSNQLGAVPLILKSSSGMPENFAYPKASLEDLYKQLISDMEEAVLLLPEKYTSDMDLGRITKPAAAHFLAKMYLNRAQAAEFQNSAEPTLKALYKGNAGGADADLQKAIQYSTMTIDLMKGNSAYGGLAPNFASLWLNTTGVDPYARDKEKEILLSAQYESTQTYNGRYGNTLVMVYNSNHTSLRACTPRTIDYGRPYATLCPTDWGYDMFTDRANDSRYYKTYLTDYVATDPKEAGGKPWDAQTAYVFNNFIKKSTDPAAVVSALSKIKYQKRSIVYIENSKDEPLDSLWVASQPFIMNVRWTVGSPNNAGYFIDPKDPSKGLKSGIDLSNPVVKNTAGRKMLYRVNGDKGEAFGLDRGFTYAQWYMSPKKWADINRGKGTDANGSGAIDVPLMRLAETYLIRAEAYGRRGDMTSAIADLNVLRKRAAYHAGETRSDVLMTLEPAVLDGKLSVPTTEKVSPYNVSTDSYEKIKITGEEWTPGTEKAKLENYPDGVTNLFIQFIYNERARELCFELTNWEDLHNAGILYERVVARDMMGAPASSTGTVNFPFPVDDISKTTGALGKGKGTYERKYTFRPWPQSFLDLLTDDKNNALDAASKQAYQNYGY